MADICQISGKSFLSGNKVSHSKRHTRTKQKANLQTKMLVNPATGQKMKVRISTSALKTLRKWDEQGKAYDLNKLVD